MFSSKLQKSVSGRRIAHAGAPLLATSAIAAAVGGTGALAAPEGAADATTGLVIEEIVVMARQRAENIQEVPISMSAVGGNALEAARIDTLQEIEHSVPNLVFGETGTSGETHVGLRGIGDFSRNIGFDTRVGVYIDGVFAGQSLAVDQGLVDVAQVEVLRGPQGTLFGKNSSSGVINIVSKNPVLEETSGEFQIGGGNHENIYGSAIVNLPLGQKAAARFSVVAQNQDGYVENLATDKDVLSNDHLMARGRLRVMPSDNLDVVFSFDIRDQDNDILFLEPEPEFELGTNPAAAERFVVDQDGPLIDDNNGWGVGLAADYDFDDGYVLTSITGYREVDRRVGSDEDATSVYALHVQFFEDEFKHFTQELRLASPDDRALRYVVGGYYFWQKGTQLRDVVLGPGFGAPADTLGARSEGEVKTRSWAAFVNANFDVTDRLTLSGGLRFTNEKKDAELTQSSLPAFGLANFTNFMDDFSEDSLTATANVTYALTAGANAYFTYSRGEKSGGWNVDFVGNASDLPFDEETVDNFELGIKSDLLDNRLRLNLSAFYAEYSDFQVFQFQFNGFTTNLIVSNAASVTTQGFEAEGVAYLSDDFEVAFGLGYADAEFDDFPGGAVDEMGLPSNVAGNALPRAPKLTASITGTYSFTVGEMEGRARLNYTRRSKQYFNPDNLAAQKAYGLLNASIDLDINETWSVAVWGRNLTNTEYRTNRGVSFLGVPFSLFAQPRTYGAELTVRF